jgi:hypothetical protein
MFGLTSQGRTRQDEREDEIYAKAGRRMLDDGGSGWGNYWQLEFQKSIDRHSAAMERLAEAIEKQTARTMMARKHRRSPETKDRT